MKWITTNVQVIKGIGGAMLLIPAPKDESLNLIEVKSKYQIEISNPKKKRSRTCIVTGKQIGRAHV